MGREEEQKKEQQRSLCFCGKGCKGGREQDKSDPHSSIIWYPKYEKNRVGPFPIHFVMQEHRRRGGCSNSLSLWCREEDKEEVLFLDIWTPLYYLWCGKRALKSQISKKEEQDIVKYASQGTIIRGIDR